MGLVLSCTSNYKPMADNDAPVDLRGTIGNIYKEVYLHCYTQNMKALCLVVSAKMILCFPIASLREHSVAMETRVLNIKYST